MPNLQAATAAIFLTVGLVGCSQNPLGRQAISGIVNVDGAPLANGSIGFQPQEGQATSAGAVVVNGKYAIEQQSGLIPGKYRVAINAPAPGTGGKAGENTLPGEAPPPPEELIPPNWNTASTQFIEVKKGSQQSFPFEISTKSDAKTK